MISMPSFILKGGGWYATEYGGRGQEGEGERPAAGEPGSSPSPAKNSEAPFSGVLEKQERPPKGAAPAAAGAHAAK